MADPTAAAPLTLDLSSLLVGGGSTVTGSALIGYLLSQWKGKRNGNDTSKIEQKIGEMVSGQRELTAELHDLNGELREFIGYMKASVK